MATKRRRRTVAKENRKFNTEWKDKYLLTSVNNKAMCLIYQNSVAQTKEYNIKRHFETNHGEKYGKYNIEEKRQLAEKLTKNLQGSMSLEIAKILSKHQVPFADDQIVKECLQKFAEVKCSQMLCVSDVSLSRHTIVRRDEDMGSDIPYQLKVKLNNTECYSLALDESTDIRDTAQLAVLIRAVDKDFNVAEELLDLNPLKGTARVVDIFEGVQASLQKMGIEDFRKCVPLCTDGAPSMIGCQNGLITKVREFKPDGIAVHCIIH
ncbi:general transcription factor II-I repeat domain-containing protein 2-like [Lepeophtheirus salmonis]|uniref:general transcription factor II-I repeat domain-containing protein 2-like n=1 Tax=Lepeophtheirus salmonis TaxID=72036 RepID=UPI001AE25874|nr:general transcription factor II-I repeat domain-containing protein 2-like [Lepeophtheirus salmonis]